MHRLSDLVSLSFPVIDLGALSLYLSLSLSLPFYNSLLLQLPVNAFFTAKHDEKLFRR